mgnify:CR=1 FL=1
MVMHNVQHKLLSGKKHIINGLLLAKRYVATTLVKTPDIANPIETDVIKQHPAQVVVNIAGGGVANDMYFKFMWQHYLAPILDRKYDEIGLNANQEVVNVIRNRLLFSDNIVDKVLVNILGFAVNIGYVHTQNINLRNKITQRNTIITDLNKTVANLNELLYGPDQTPSGNSEISINVSLEETNMLKHYVNLNLYLGLYFYLFGYDGSSALNKNYYMLIKQTVDMHRDRIFNGVLYNTEFIKSKLIESINTGAPFELFNDLQYNIRALS